MLKEFYENKALLTEASSIARTTQMLAHDVRKPFTMMEALIDLVKSASNTKESQNILQENLPLITQAIKSVNGMIQDVMTIGAKPNLIIETIYCKQFIFDILRPLFQYKSLEELKLIYDFDIETVFNIDPVKYARVFQNIVSNAVEHMNAIGSIWIQVTTPKNGFSIVTLGNTNSFIPLDDRERLFESFFTKDKKGGTGLGLAISKKIVEAHGGTIWCESSKEKGTEFKFTIPAAIVSAPTSTIDLVLPMRASDYQKSVELGNRETIVEDDLLDPDLLSQVRKRTYHIAVVDDERIYIDALRAKLEAFEANIDFTEFASGRKILDRSSDSFDIIVLDVDLGTENGFDVCRTLRSKGYEGVICIHSNRGQLEYQPKAIASGANYFLPKPMKSKDLLQLLASTKSASESTKSEIKEKVIVFEDEKIFQRQWKKTLSGYEVEIFPSLDTFDFSSSADARFIVCDYYLEKGDTGVDVAKKLKEIGYSGKVFLSSNIDELSDADKELFDAIVSKNPREALKVIEELLKDD